MNNTTNDSTCIICQHGVDVTLTVFQIIFGIGTFLGNTITFIVITKTKGIDKTLRYSLYNLAVTDIVLGLIFIYHYSVVYVFYDNPLECYLRYVTVSVLSAATLMIVLFLSLSRFISVKYPYRYRQIINTKTIMVFIIVCCWINPTIIIVSVFPHYSTITECNYVLITNQLADCVFSITMIVIVIISLSCHIALYFEALDQIQKIVPTFLSAERRQMEFQMHIKATKSTVTVVLPILICTTPMYVMFLVMAISPSLKRHLTTLYIQNGLYNLSALISFFNPAIYAWKVVEIRQTFKKIFCSKKIKKNEINGKVLKRQPEKKTQVFVISKSKKPDPNTYMPAVTEEILI